MAEFNSYLLGKARKSVGNLTIVYAKGKKIVRAKVFGRKDNPTPEVLVQRMKSEASRQVRPAYPACHPQRLCGSR